MQKKQVMLDNLLLNQEKVKKNEKKMKTIRTNKYTFC